ncbi:uncharacterized protein LOC126847393 [Adelges cooleyi]|uniref:uncharacterized protein LOC126847393 n=1 Tax=Adelges cooleyi TaxID=133065 RepID=UPI002180894A|nr:uncharacterized protein LOC126847393 [Adelges cooleyi]
MEKTEFDVDDADGFDEDLISEDSIEEDSKVDLLTKSVSSELCCGCNCIRMFDQEFKKRLLIEMSRLSDSEKRIYLFALISLKEQKKFNSVKPKPTKVFQYSIKEYGVTRVICKNSFITLHGTTIALVRNLCHKMRSNCLFPTDKRGKHEKRPTIPDKMKEQIRLHFFSILDSPVIFSCAKKLGKPNVSKMWMHFIKNHGHIARSTYTKYIASLLTPEVRMKYMCANEAKLILQELQKYNYN